MTVVPPEGPIRRELHVGELRLRRFRLGELPAAEAAEVEAHTAACGSCRVRLRALDDEQRAFERAVPFERFAGGVERARRVPRRRARPAVYLGSAGLAALAALVVLWIAPRPPANRIKGADSNARLEARLQVAAVSGEQQSLAPGEQLALRAGERVRLGVRTASPRHLGAVSVDDAGEVTALYPERGAALAVAPGPALTFLPDSLEFTGQGRERVFVVLAPGPFAIEDLAERARAAFRQAHANLDTLVALPGAGDDDQFTWLLRKP